jgi:hypothetical protein
MAGAGSEINGEGGGLTPSLRAKRSNPYLNAGIDGLLRRFAPLRKRFAFVAGNDGCGVAQLCPHAGAGTAARATGIGLNVRMIRNAPRPMIQEPI